MRRSRHITVLALPMLALFIAVSLAAQNGRLVAESYHIPAREAGIQLYVRNKRPEAMTSFTPDRTLLFVHGASYPAETSFDLQVDGMSWMDFIAQHGYDVYLMDVRGYGRSTRPPEMEQSAGANRPIVHTDVAVQDFSTVVDHIRSRRGVSKITLLGWSWGTTIAGAYTAQNNDKVERLVLYAPLWVRQPPPAIDSDSLGAYRTITMDAARQQWLAGAPAEAQKELIPSGWFEAWWQANLEADPGGAAQNPSVVRAPNGVVEDARRFWDADTRYYDPSQIRVPVLLVHGQWDVNTPSYMAQAVLARLTGTPVKRYVVIGEGTHTILLERNRMQLFREVQLFLDEGN